MEREIDSTPPADDETELAGGGEQEHDERDAAEDLARNEGLVDQEPGSAAPGDDSP